MLRRYLKLSVLYAWLAGIPFLALGVLMYCILTGPAGIEGERLKALLVLGGIGLLAWCLALGMTWWPGLRPTYRSLRRFGPPEQLIDAIDEELARPGEVVCVRQPELPASPRRLKGQAVLTRSWVVMFRESLEAAAVPLGEVVWVMSVAIPGQALGAGTVLTLRTGGGVDEGLHLRSDDAAALLFELLLRRPWLAVGINFEWEKEWRRGQREQILAWVEEERQRVAALPEEKLKALIAEKVVRTGQQTAGLPAGG
jgi:hypothetical protein